MSNTLEVEGKYVYVQVHCTIQRCYSITVEFDLYLVLHLNWEMKIKKCPNAWKNTDDYAPVHSQAKIKGIMTRHIVAMVTYLLLITNNVIVLALTHNRSNAYHSIKVQVFATNTHEEFNHLYRPFHRRFFFYLYYCRKITMGCTFSTRMAPTQMQAQTSSSLHSFPLMLKKW